MREQLTMDHSKIKEELLRTSKDDASDTSVAIDDLYVLQGLEGYTLVAGKSTALRHPIDSPQASQVDHVMAKILRPDGSKVEVVRQKDEYVSVPPSQFIGLPSIVATIPGWLLPWVGTYYFRLELFNVTGDPIGSTSYWEEKLLPTKDLRVIVTRIWSGTPQKPGEIEAVGPAMRRMSALFPIRDGVSVIDGDRNSGLRYLLDNNPMGPPNQDGHICPLLERYANRPPNVDSVDVGIAYRFPNPGEGSGGNADHKCDHVKFSVIVWGAPLTVVFCQETGHIFGLEPPSDPHIDPDHGPHSKDITIDPRDAALGFDIQYNEAWPNPTYEIMHWESPDPDYPDQSVCLNSWDWEYLRQQITKLSSTGPTEPFIVWQNLEGHDLRPFPAVGKNADGRQEVFVLGGDQAIYHRWERSSGGDWSDWASLGGHDLQEPFTVTNDASGRLQLFVLGGDRKIYYRGQSAPNGTWGDWALLGGNGVRDFAVGRNADGRLEVVAVWDDGALHDVWQVAPNSGWSDWANLAGHDLQGEVALGQNADGRLEAFVVGGDGVVYNRWQTAPNNGWGDWSSLRHPSLPQIADVAVVNGADGRLFVFMMRSDRALSYRAQNSPNATGWDDPINLEGHDLLWPCAVGRLPDGRLEVFVVGGDRQIYNRWQLDVPFQPEWSVWQGLGGRQIQAGIGIGTDLNGEFDLYVIGGDGKLYRGPLGTQGSWLE